MARFWLLGFSHGQDNLTFHKEYTSVFLHSFCKSKTSHFTDIFCYLQKGILIYHLVYFAKI